MTLTRQQFREQLIDYVYDQLAAPDRAAFEACLAESDEYRRELGELRSTLQLAREGLAALEEDPPARVKRAVLAAARTRPVVKARFSALWLAPLSVAAVVGLAVLVKTRTPERAAPSTAPVSAPAVREASPEPPADEAARAPEASEAPGSGAADRSAPAAPQPSKRGAGGLGRARSERPAANAAPAPAHVERAEGAALPAAAEAEAKTKAKAPPSAAQREAHAYAPDPSVHDADQHLSQGRWRDAARSYRTLLKQYPSDPRARAWRSALQRAEREDAARAN